MTGTDKIVVFGEALVDDFITEQVVGGAPFNVARHLAAFGASPLAITRIGEDAAGALVRAEFSYFGMAQHGLQIDPHAPTGRVVVERADGQHRFIILPEQAYDAIDADLALAACAAHAPELIYFGTLAQRADTSRAALRAMLQASPARRYLDLNVRSGQVSERCVYESLCEAAILKVNEEELADLFGWYTHERHDTADMQQPSVHKACFALMRSFGLEAMIVTLGARGAMYFHRDGRVIASAAPPQAVRLVDTVGAGDAFSAIFLLGQSLGWPVEETLARANEFAGAICGIAGAVPASLGFYQPFRSRWLA